MAQPLLYVETHQDDLALSMGGSARKHIEAGLDVHVLLLTTGINSGARAATGLNRVDFALARDDEWYRAAREIGIRTRNMHVSRFSTEDGELEVQDAEDAITEFLGLYPTAWVKTYSNLGPTTGSSARHPDHVATGQAAVNLLKNGTIVTNGLRQFVEPWLLTPFKTANPSITLSADRAAKPAAVQAALDVFKEVDQVAGKYGIGDLSVGDEIDLVRADPTSWYHVPVLTTVR